MKAAITALGKGDGAAALEALHGVITMDWGADVSKAGYESTLGIFYSTPYLNWATGAMPWITNVHDEYDAVAAKWRPETATSTRRSPRCRRSSR